MKKNNIFFMAALAAMAGLTACSSDEEATQSNYPADGVVRFNVDVNDSQTRASHSDATTLEEFGVFIYNSNTANGTETPTYTYNNVAVTGSNTAGWTPKSQMLWQSASQAVDIIAYAPYSKDNNERSTFSVAVPVTVDATGQSADSYESDFLICKKTSFVPERGLNSDGKVELEFTHALSQLTVTIKFGTEFNESQGQGTDADGNKILTADPITSGTLVIGGTKVTGTCDFTATANFVTASTDATATDVTPYAISFTAAATTTSNASAEYQGILIPQTVKAGEFYVYFEIGDTPYQWTNSSDITFAENTSYTLPLTVGSDKIILASDGITTSPWKSGNNDGESLETK